MVWQGHILWTNGHHQASLRPGPQARPPRSRWTSAHLRSIHRLERGQRHPGPLASHWLRPDLQWSQKDLCKSRPKLRLSQSSGGGGGRKLLRCALLVALSSHPTCWAHTRGLRLGGKLALSSLLTGTAALPFPQSQSERGAPAPRPELAQQQPHMAARTEFPRDCPPPPTGKGTGHGWGQHRLVRLGWLGALQGGQFSSQPGHTTGLWAQSPLGVCRMFLSLPL